MNPSSVVVWRIGFPKSQRFFVVHIMTGTFAHGVHKTIYLAIGVVLGSQLGAYLSQRIRGQWIIRSLAIALALLGLRILVVALQGGT